MTTNRLPIRIATSTAHSVKAQQIAKNAPVKATPARATNETKGNSNSIAYPHVDISNCASNDSVAPASITTGACGSIS